MSLKGKENVSTWRLIYYIYTVTLPEYIYVNGLCLIMKSRDSCPSLLIYCKLTNDDVTGWKDCVNSETILLV